MCRSVRDASYIARIYRGITDLARVTQRVASFAADTSTNLRSHARDSRPYRASQRTNERTKESRKSLRRKVKYEDSVVPAPSLPGFTGENVATGQKKFWSEARNRESSKNILATRSRVESTFCFRSRDHDDHVRDCTRKSIGSFDDRQLRANERAMKCPS